MRRLRLPSVVFIGNGMALSSIRFYWKFVTVACAVFGLADGAFVVQYQTPADCVKLSSNAAVSLYFNSIQLKCVECEQPSAAQTVSPDGAFPFRLLDYFTITADVYLLAVLTDFGTSEDYETY